MKFKNTLQISLLLLISLTISSCTNTERKIIDHTSLVNPFVGTVGSGNTFMGPVMPFGMVQLGPYLKYSEDKNSGTIYGFSHTHTSGMAGGGNGVPGEINFIPIIDDGNSKNIYQSKFKHSTEIASPGYYRVVLEDYNIEVELTSTVRVGFHKYTFPKGNNSSVVLKLGNGEIDINDNEISGQSKEKVFFVAKFSKPFKKIELKENGKASNNSIKINGKNVTGLFSFDSEKDEAIYLKVAISMVSVEGARKNLEVELKDWNFEKVKENAKSEWAKELGKIDVEGGSKIEQIIFYTSLYHAMIQPTIYMDVDSRYRSTDGNIYKATDFVNYTNFSLWDTFRALHPLYTIINRERTSDFIKTFLERYDHTGRMLIMEFEGVEGTIPPMIGYHSLSVLADAYVKRIRDYDVPKAYKAMKKLANDTDRIGKQLYFDYGFIPGDLKGQDISRSLEYNYDDWCVTRLAKDFSDEDFLYYTQRGDFYKNTFSKKENFMVGRKSNFQFIDDFDPMETTGHYTEANAYQYSSFVPQDIYGLIALMGGDKKFETWLDNLFTTETDFSKINVRDVTGLIGQYAHGNEPSHHIAYLYNYVGTPWKTQQMVREILSTLYTDKQDGIDGNEDCGQMSAWYVMSAMGIYSVTPGLDYYAIGSPIFDRVKINLENGKSFEIITKNNSNKNVYIKSATLNGKSYSKTYLKNDDIMNGGKLVFEMSSKPNREFGNEKKDRPYFPERKIKYAKTPIVEFSNILFLNSRTVTLYKSENNSKIYYTLDGTEPTEESMLYSNPITLIKTSTLKCRSYVDGISPSYPLTINFTKMEMLEAESVSGLAKGLKYYFVDEPVENALTVMDYPITESGIIKDFNVDKVKDQRPFGFRFEGYLKVPKTGVYTFSLEANDGAILYLHGKMIIDNDGGHRAQKLDSKIGLKKGMHTIVIDYFQQGLAKSLDVTWEGENVKRQKISNDVLFYKK